MEFKKAFDYIVGKVEEELVKQNYTKQKVVAENDNELVSLFTSATLAYSVVYYKDKEQMVLRSCTMTDEGPDNEWKTLATWLYDETVGTQKDADSIANDFIEGVSGTLAIKRAKQVKQKKKKDDDGTADPKFLAKRFVTYFPELREKLKTRRIVTSRSEAQHSQKSILLRRFPCILSVQIRMKSRSLQMCSMFSTTTVMLTQGQSSRSFCSIHLMTLSIMHFMSTSTTNSRLPL